MRVLCSASPRLCQSQFTSRSATHKKKLLHVSTDIVRYSVPCVPALRRNIPSTDKFRSRTYVVHADLFCSGLSLFHLPSVLLNRCGFVFVFQCVLQSKHAASSGSTKKTTVNATKSLKQDFAPRSERRSIQETKRARPRPHVPLLPGKML